MTTFAEHSMRFLLLLTAAIGLSQREPDEAIRGFASAVSRWDASAASQFVDGAKPSMKLIAAWSQLKKTPIPIEIRNLTIQIEGRMATARFDTVIPGGPTRGTSESLKLIQRELQWRIVPPKPKADATAPLSLGSFASLIAYFDSVTDESASGCAENLRVAASKLLEAFAANGRKIDWPAEGISKLLDDKIPSCPSGEIFSINVELKGKSLDEIKKPHEIVLLYEGKDRKLSFRHGNRASVAFLDGVVRFVDRAGSRKLKWK